jgi:succinate dehydrogenase / fumarate reductase cytochrome b subunit
MVRKGLSIVSQTTAASVSISSIPGQSFLLRRLHSLTGLVFGGYIVVHLIVNATQIEGGVGRFDVYQLQVDKIHALPFLWVIEWVFIYLPIIFHTVYGVAITLGGQPNVEKYPYAKNYLYVVQRISAVVIVLFLLFHVLGMKGLLGRSLEFVPENASMSTARHINSSLWVAYFVYPLGIIASCFHLANGFWTAGITWGLTISAAAQRRWGYVCFGLFVFTLVCGFLALMAAIDYKVMVLH